MIVMTLWKSVCMNMYEHVFLCESVCVCAIVNVSIACVYCVRFSYLGVCGNVHLKVCVCV